MEQKFRAFDKSMGLHGRMVYLAGFVKYGEGWNGGDPKFKFYELYYSTGGFYKTEASRVVIMPFIGKMDKTEKDIYLGDILKVIGTKRVGEYITFVVYKDHGFTLDVNKTYFKDHCCITRTEKIGNIYENPELLKP